MNVKSEKILDETDSNPSIIDETKVQLIVHIKSLISQYDESICEQLYYLSSQTILSKAFMDEDIMNILYLVVKRACEENVENNDNENSIKQNRIDLTFTVTTIFNNLLFHKDRRSEVISYIDILLNSYSLACNLSFDPILLKASLQGFRSILSYNLSKKITDVSFTIANTITLILSNSLDSDLLGETFELLLVIFNKLNTEQTTDSVIYAFYHQMTEEEGLDVFDLCVSRLKDSESISVIREYRSLQNKSFSLFIDIIQESFAYKWYHVSSNHNNISHLSTDESSSSSSSGNKCKEEESKHSVLDDIDKYIRSSFHILCDRIISSEYSYEEKIIVFDFLHQVIEKFVNKVSSNSHSTSSGSKNTEKYSFDSDFLSILAITLQDVITGDIIFGFHELLIEAVLRKEVDAMNSIAFILISIYFSIRFIRKHGDFVVCQKMRTNRENRVHLGYRIEILLETIAFNKKWIELKSISSISSSKKKKIVI